MIANPQMVELAEMADQDNARATWGARVRPWVGPTTLVLVGVLGLIGSAHLGFGGTREPGPGLWPGLVSALVVLSALVMGPQPDTEAMTKDDTGRVAVALSLLGLFIVLFSRMGILIPTFVVLAVWLRLLARRSLFRSGVIALASALSLYLVFTVIFNVGA